MRRSKENHYCPGEDCLKTQMFIDVGDSWVCAVCTYRLYKTAGTKGGPEQKDTRPPLEDE